MARMKSRLPMMLAGLLALSTTGCSLHLHRPADAKQAQTAIETYDKVSFDSIVKTARDNAAALDKAEGDAIQQLTELVIRRDLAGVITEAPLSNKDPAGVSRLPRGWFKLVEQIRVELDPLQILDPLSMRFLPGAEDDAKRLKNRIHNREYVTSDRAKFDRFVRTYKSGQNPGTRGARCDYPPPQEQTPEAAEQIVLDNLPKDPPEGESQQKREYYVAVLVPTCAGIREGEKKADLNERMMRETAYKELADKVEVLERQLGVRDGSAKRLTEKYTQARTAFEEAQANLAQLTNEKQTEGAKAEAVKVQKAAAALADALNEAQKVPYVEALAKTDPVTKQFLALLQTYPAVAARLRVGATPSMNVLLMELTIQRLALTRATVDRDKIADEVNLLRAQRDLRVERAAAWLRVVDMVQSLMSVSALESQPLVSVYAGTADGKEKGRIEDVLQAYAFTRLKYDVLDASLTFQERQRERAYAMDMSEVALITWRDFIRAPLQEIATYHEGGIRSEDLANLIQAIGVAGITAGLNK